MNAQPMDSFFISYIYVYVYVYTVIVLRLPKPQISFISFYCSLFSLFSLYGFLPTYTNLNQFLKYPKSKNMQSFNGTAIAKATPKFVLVRSTISIKLCIQYGTAVFCSPFFFFIFIQFLPRYYKATFFPHLGMQQCNNVTIYVENDRLSLTESSKMVATK